MQRKGSNPMFYRKHARVTQPVGEISRTKQSHKDECDIYRILRQYQRTGVITHVSSARPLFATLPDAMDYQASIEAVTRAEDAFAALPARVRDHFQNDPLQLLLALRDPDQADKLREIGLLAPGQVVPDAGPTEPA